MLTDLGSAYATCSGDCTTPAGQWQVHPSPTTADLGAAFPTLWPASCTGAIWQMWNGPSMALDALGRPFLSFTAQSKGVGGECGTGSAAITTTSFLFSPG